MADVKMMEMANSLCNKMEECSEVRIKESENSVTLYIKPTESFIDYKVIIMEHKPKRKDC